MIPNFALTAFPTFKDESALRLPSGADVPVARPAAAAGAVAYSSYAYGPDVPLPSFTGFLQAGHVKPLGLRLARGRQP